MMFFSDKHQIPLGLGLLLGTFVCCGVGLLIGAGVVFVQDQRFNAHAQHAEGTVIGHSFRISDGDRHDCSIVQFNSPENGMTQFTSSTCSKPPANQEGDRVKVLYEAGHPGNARIDSFMERWFVILMMGGIGSFFLLLTLPFAIPIFRPLHLAKTLAVSGRPVQAQVVEVARDTSFTYNGRSPWRIHAQWQDPATRKMHVFKSAMLWYDPTQFVGEHVTVLVDPAKPKRYWLDTRFLPELA